MGTGGYYAAKADGDDTKLYGGGGAAGAGALIFSSYMIAGIDTTEYNPTTSRLEVGALTKCARQDTPVSLAATSGVRGDSVSSWSLNLDNNAVRFTMNDALKGAQALEKKFSEGPPKAKKKKRKRYRRNRYRRWNRRGAKKTSRTLRRQTRLHFKSLSSSMPLTCVKDRFGRLTIRRSVGPKGDSEASFLRKDGQELCFD